MIRQVALGAALALAPASAVAASADGAAFTPVHLADLPGVDADDLAAALRAFKASCAAVEGAVPPLRAALPPPPGLRAACRAAAALPADAPARGFFERAFTVRRLAAPAFFTGYYEPVVEASPVPADGFATPLLALPARGGPLPDRAGIETGALGRRAVPLAYVREPVDAFFVQVQGSARLLMPDGSTRRLAFAGRNGYPYTSVGKLLVDELHVPPAAMGMAELKAWVRAHGQGEGDAGTALMRRNRSYVFFRFDDALPADAGPVGAAGVSLTALRSLAVDRAAWPYGLPMYVDAVMPDGARLARMLVAQDTGSAITGATRADVFFGTGPAAAAAAGPVRQAGTLYVLWPNDAPPGVSAR